MVEQSDDALRELVRKSQTKVHKIREVGVVVGDGDAAVLQISIPLKELSRARQGTGQRHSLGFSLVVEFVLPGGVPAQLHSGWMSLTAR